MTFFFGTAVRAARKEYRRSPRLLGFACAWCVAVVLGSAPALAASAFESGDLAAACDGSGDAGPVLQAAYDQRAAAGGGTIVLPEGHTCRIATPVAVRSQVNLRCSPGSQVVAAIAEAAALAGVGVRDASIESCELIVSASGGSALDLSGEGLRVLDSHVRTDRDAVPERPLVRLRCEADGECHLSRNRVVCGGPAVTKGKAIEVHVAEGGHAYVGDNRIRGCRFGIDVSGRASISGNDVEGAGDASVAVGIRSSRADPVDVSRNQVRIAGHAGRGIAIDGWGALVDGNRVFAVGEGVRAFTVKGGDIRLVGNAHVIDGASSAGYETSSSTGIVIDSCTGRASKKSPGQVHVSLAGTQQVVVSDCLLRYGDYGVAQGSESAINVTVDSNRMIGMAKACVVVTTGFSVTSNYCAWLGEDAVALVLGDDRPPGEGNVHAVITGNLLHCSKCRALIVPTSRGGRCLQGSRRPCRGPQDCPTQQAARGGQCLPPRVESIVIVNNILLGVADGVGIDFGGLNHAGAARLANLVIQGNQLSMHGACTAIRFPPDPKERSSIDSIAIGGNSTRCPTELSGFDETMGRVLPR